MKVLTRSLDRYIHQKTHTHDFGIKNFDYFEYSDHSPNISNRTF